MASCWIEDVDAQMWKGIIEAKTLDRKVMKNKNDAISSQEQLIFVMEHHRNIHHNIDG